jgi:uncharacterized membrane protein YdjX (TVP38/TMEM64 family)
MTRSRWSAVGKVALVVVAVVALVYGLRQSPLGRQLSSIDAARSFVGSLAPFDKPAFVVIYAVGALFLPGTLLSFVGAVLYGVWWGTALVWMGAILGSVTPYAVARIAGRSAVDGLIGGDSTGLDRFNDLLARRGFTGLLLVRFLPIFPYWLVNYGCGLIGVRFRDYVVATAIGILPGTFVYQYLFANLGEAMLERGLRWSDLGDPVVLGPIAAFAAFILIGRLIASTLNRSAAAKRDSMPSAAPIKPIHRRDE